MATIAWIKKENITMDDTVDCGYSPTYESAIYSFFKNTKIVPKEDCILIVDRGYQPSRHFLIKSKNFKNDEIQYEEVLNKKCISELKNDWKRTVFNKVFQNKKMIKEFEDYLRSCNVDEDLFKKDNFEGKKYYSDNYIHNAFIVFSESQNLKPEERTLVNFVDSEPPCVNDFDKKCLLNGDFDKIDDWPMSLFSIFQRDDEKVKEYWSCR